MGDGKTVQFALPLLILRWWVVIALGSCGEVEFDGGNLSAEVAFVEVAACVACCLLLESSGIRFLSFALSPTTEGAEFFERPAGIAVESFIGMVIHDFKCRLPST